MDSSSYIHTVVIVQKVTSLHLLYYNKRYSIKICNHVTTYSSVKQALQDYTETKICLKDIKIVRV